MSFLPPTNLADACREAWDVVVIGAGPAGSLGAREAARQGLRTLLVEAKPFPRAKVCGGCLNARALQALERLGLGGLAPSCGAEPLETVKIQAGQRAVSLPLPRGVVLTRQTLDHALVTEAIEAGVAFLPETSVAVQPANHLPIRLLIARQAGMSRTLQANVVLCADGLGRSSARLLPELRPRIASGARVGVGAVFPESALSPTARQAYPRGRVVLAVATGGYVGMARAEAGKIIVAAALAPKILKQYSSQPDAVDAILASAGLPLLEANETRIWQGTPLLTSRARRVATTRLFVIGDAAGYVEPFTGEGMAWAAEGAEAVTPLVVDACRRWHPALAAAWEARYQIQIRRRQHFCQTIAAILRRPWAVSLALKLVRSSPALADRLVSWIHQPPRGRSSVALQS